MRAIWVVTLWAACSPAQPPPARVAPPPAPKRVLMAASPLEGYYDLMHFKWLDTAAPPKTELGKACRTGSMSMLADELEAKLRGCLAACTGGDPPSCVIAAAWLLEATGNDAADRPHALALLERACASHDDPLACFFLGEHLDRGAHVAPHDPVRAQAAWRAGCDQHEDNSCAALRGERLEIDQRVIYEAPRP